MTNRPYVLLSCAISVDGYLDDATDKRLVLSNEADFDRVDEVRASVDAILVGANTIRRDNPRLLVRSHGPAQPIKVTLTSSGDLDPSALFFTEGEVAKLVYTPVRAIDKVSEHLAGVATVVGVDGLEAVLDDLGARGVRRLMVEGGGVLLTQFLSAGLADELNLAIAPILVGDERAPRFVHSGQFPGDMRLAEVLRLGDVVVLRYLLGAVAVDRYWLGCAVNLSHRCPPSTTAFSVGAIIVDASGNELARGYSRETDDTVHAEESALAKVDLSDPLLRTATLYSSLEPCSQRTSRPRSCSQLILDARIPRVVFALREPPTFVDGSGAELLAAAGVSLIEIDSFAEEVREVNRHLA